MMCHCVCFVCSVSVAVSALLLLSPGQTLSACTQSIPFSLFLALATERTRKKRGGGGGEKAVGARMFKCKF